MNAPIGRHAPAFGDRVEVEVALRDSEARLHSVVNSAPMILWALDAQGVFTSSEGRGLSRLGLAPADVVGRSAFDVYADVPQILADTRRALAGEEFTSVVEVAGSIFESRYSVVRAADGSVRSVIGVAIDITERRETEEALRRAERRAQTVADRLQAVAGAAAGVIGAESLDALQTVLRDACGKVISFDTFTFARYDAASHRLEYMAGYDGDVFVPGATIPATGVPSERAIRERRSLVTLHAADPSAEGGILMGTGRRSESVIRTPILSADEVLGVIAVQSYTPRLYTDDDVGVLEAIASLAATALTSLRLRAERREAEEALRFSETRFRTMFEQFPLSVQIFDPDGRALEVNRAWGELFDVTLDEVRDYNPLHDPQLEGVRPLLERAFGGETLTTPPHPFYPYLRGAGAGAGSAGGTAEGAGVRLLEATICPVKDPGGEIREVIIVHHDVSARHRAEEALRASEASYRTIFELASDAIFVHDVATGAILDANRKACELHGTTLEELKALGVPGISEGIPPFDAAHARQHIVRAAAGEPQLFEWRVKNRAGQRFWVEVSLHRVPILGEDRVLASVRNITERKAAEAALRAARDELEERVEERTAELADTNMALEEEIGERERAELELRQKTAEMEAVVRALPDLYLRLSADGVILDYQAGQTAHVAVPTEGWVGRHIREFLPPDVGPRFCAGFDEVMVATEPVCVEYSVGGDAPREFEARLLPMAGDQIICVVRDITDRRQAELALQRSEEHFRALIENSSDIATIIGPDGVSRYQSPSFERVLGYAPSERTGTRPFDMMHPDDAPAARAALVRMMSDPGTTHEVEFRYRHKDGSWRFIEAVGRTLLADSAEAGVIVNSRDVTARREAEEALRHSEASYRGLFDNLAELVYIQDLEGRFLNVNEAVVRTYGYTREELIGQTPAMLADPDRVAIEDTRARFRRAVEGEPQRTEWWGRRRDGSTFPKDLVLARSTYFGQDVVIAVARDITEQKKAEEALRRSEEHFRSLIENASDLITIFEDELRRAKVEAESANRAKSEFLSRMSHELRTPMNSILGFAQLLDRKPLAPDDKRGVEHILKGGRHLLNLINEVLDIARIEANRQQLSLEPVRASTVIAEALNLIRPLAVQRGCRIDEPGDLPEIHVRADRQRLTQVLLNLLSNAVKYNRPGGSATVVWEVEGPGDGDGGGGRLRIGVRDTGPGIAEESLLRIFEPFERLGAERSGEEGTGLGLALSRRLVEAMGGTLTVESTEGRGSTFWVELRREVSPVERLENGERSRPAAVPPRAQACRAPPSSTSRTTSPT
jgi:PAS domain S-box-containing protein